MSIRIESMSLYWKCQIIGWGIFTFLTSIINILTNHFQRDSYLRGLIVFMIGVSLTHLIRWWIKKLEIFKKPLIARIFYLLVIDFVTCLLSSLLFIYLLNISGILNRNIPERQHNQPFYNFYLDIFFQMLIVVSGWVLIYFLVQYFREIKIIEREKMTLKIKLIESESQALRAQMNPHFIFNCLNSIKSLIQQNENEKSVTYLTTFSKLIRTLLNNADKKYISMHDEIETCKLYLQLEAMRFDAKFSFAVNVDANIDLKSIQVPALIIQPFIENAIWHGIVPRNSGGKVSLNVLRKDGVIEVVIDDDGIGREASKQNRSASGLTHQSKGINLTQSRLELNNLLQQRQAELDFFDKKDENDVATGTKVILNFKESE